MRLRKVKNAHEKLKADTKYFVDKENNYKGRWKSVFNNDNPIHIEIGCGKGQFMMELAKKNPNINYVAIEKYDSVLLRVSEKANEYDIPNLRITIIDANEISNYFDKGEVERIYLNFSDPWPKNHHAKRRLTSKIFLDQYRLILSSNGEIHQKTDNRGLFEYSVCSLSKYGYTIEKLNVDLHNSSETNIITTEYEDKFVEAGLPIYQVVATKE